MAGSFRFVDLFSGIGGFHAALTSLGGECVLASEIDRDAAEVYRRNFGITPAGDIRTVEASDVPDHDLLAAGFPCQAFSKAGQQLGLKDETRGTLFFEIARILERKRPRFILLENVRNLARHDGGRTWTIIVQRLSELGYRVPRQPVVFSPHLLGPSLGGSPQFRERVFILGEHESYWSGADEDALVLGNQPVDGWRPEEWDLKRWLGAVETDENLSQFALRDDEEHWLLAWGDFARRIKGPLPGFPLWEFAFRSRPTLTGHPAWKQDFLRKNSVFYLDHRKQVDAWRQSWKPESFPESRRKFEWQAQDSPRRRAEDVLELLIHMRPSGIRVKRPTYAPALVAITQTSILGWERRRLTPKEAASLQGFPSTFRLHENPAAAYKQLGNAVHVGVVKHLASHLFRWAGFTAEEAFGSIQLRLDVTERALAPA